MLNLFSETKGLLMVKSPYLQNKHHQDLSLTPEGGTSSPVYPCSLPWFQTSCMLSRKASVLALVVPDNTAAPPCPRQRLCTLRLADCQRAKVTWSHPQPALPTSSIKESKWTQVEMAVWKWFLMRIWTADRIGVSQENEGK